MSEAIDFDQRLRDRQNREAERLEAAETRQSAPLPRWGSYTRFARFMRYLLPAVAAALIALLIFWPRIQGEVAGMTGFGVSGQPPVEEDGTTAKRARFEGVDGKNRPFSISAERAFQPNGDSNRIVLDSPEADITLNDGSWVAVTAERGDYRQNGETLELRGQVNLFHDKGFEFYTESVDVDLESGVAQGSQAVQGQGPFGHIAAEGFELRDNGQTIVFTGKTELVVYPEEKGQQ
ncbi:MAG: LPS export ABC transporter periplasmic protein LptC [Rhodovibrionaceae bacterium]